MRLRNNMRDTFRKGSQCYPVIKEIVQLRPVFFSALPAAKHLQEISDCCNIFLQFSTTNKEK